MSTQLTNPSLRIYLFISSISAYNTSTYVFKRLKRRKLRFSPFIDTPPVIRWENRESNVVSQAPIKPLEPGCRYEEIVATKKDTPIRYHQLNRAVQQKGNEILFKTSEGTIKYSFSTLELSNPLTCINDMNLKLQPENPLMLKSKNTQLDCREMAFYKNLCIFFFEQNLPRVFYKGEEVMSSRLVSPWSDLMNWQRYHVGKSVCLESGEFLYLKNRILNWVDLTEFANELENKGPSEAVKFAPKVLARIVRNYHYSEDRDLIYIDDDGNLKRYSYPALSSRIGPKSSSMSTINYKAIQVSPKRIFTFSTYKIKKSFYRVTCHLDTNLQKIDCLDRIIDFEDNGCYKDLAIFEYKRLTMGIYVASCRKMIIFALVRGKTLQELCIDDVKFACANLYGIVKVPKKNNFVIYGEKNCLIFSILYRS